MIVSDGARKKKTSSKRIPPYNLFVKKQWELRRDEFKEITAKTGIPSIMKLLSKEWNRDPKLKEEYQKKANELNRANIEPIQESAI